MPDKKPEVQFTDGQFNTLANSLKQNNKLLEGILSALNKQRSEADKYRKALKTKSDADKKFATKLRDSKGKFAKQSIQEQWMGKVLERQEYNTSQLNARHKNLFELLGNINPALSGLIQTIYRLGETFKSIIYNIPIFGKGLLNVINILGPFARIGGALFLIMKPVFDRYRDIVKGVFEGGFGGRLATKFSTVDKMQDVGVKLFNDTGIVTSAEDITKYAVDTATALQNWNVPNALIQDVAYLNKAFMISSKLNPGQSTGQE